MSGPGEPPDGTPEGAPGGGDDEYRSVVFDESFVRAARIQEFSARERLDDAARPVRIRHVLPRGLARQAVALILLLVTAFAFAIYMGVRHPYQGSGTGSAEQLRITVIPLVPDGRVPAVPAAAPFAGGSAAHYPAGAKGLTLPSRIQRVGGYTQDEVRAAFDTAKEYLTDSSLDPRTVTGGDVGAVRSLIDPGQLDQFDSSLSGPEADGRHEATGWLVRFDPSAQVTLLHDGIRVRGTLDVTETSDNALEIVSDHTFVYALRGTGTNTSAVSLFTVRRQLRFRFDHEDLREHHIEVVQADVAAGPLACSASVDAYFQPILAGRSAPGTVTGADPYDHDHPVGAVCAPLGSGGLPTTRHSAQPPTRTSAGPSGRAAHRPTGRPVRPVSGSPAAGHPTDRPTDPASLWTPTRNPPLLLPTPDPIL